MVNDTGSAIWTDDQIQATMDYHRTHIRREYLNYDPDQKLYYSRRTHLEGSYITDQEDGASWDGDPEIIQIWDDDEDDATEITPDSWNLVDGSFGFSTDQDDEYWLQGKSYDLHGAAADLFEELAADSSRASKWARGSVIHESVSPLTLAKYHRAQSGPMALHIDRTYRTEAND